MKMTAVATVKAATFLPDILEVNFTDTLES